MKKIWATCINCEYNSLCKSGHSRLKGLDYDSPTAQDIGCFGFEIYNLQTTHRQLNLFKNKEELF